MTDTVSNKKKWREVPEYDHWKRAVIARDGTCQSCGTQEGLHAHHIRHATYWPDSRYDPDNGIALCGDCHMTFHNDYVGNTRKKCDEKMLSEFMRIRNLFARKFLSDVVRRILHPDAGGWS